MIPEREREALMRLTMCAREECGMCKYKETCDFDFQYETATRCMNILADALNADRKTEPQTNKDFEVTYTCSFTDCDNFKNFGFGEKCIECKRKQSEAKYKDEPQTDCSWK